MGIFIIVSSVHPGTLMPQQVCRGYNALTGLLCSIALDSRQQCERSNSVQAANPEAASRAAARWTFQAMQRR